MKSIGRFFRKSIRRARKALFVEQWSILILDENGSVLRHIEPPADRIWADPFPAESDGRTYIFLEQQYRGKNGTLGFIELNDDLSWTTFTQILETDYHLSYPNVFKIGSDWYMIPETHEHATIDLYRAERFPDKWAYDRTLIDGVRAVDTTLLCRDSTWWLFTTECEAGHGYNGSLSLYHADGFPSCDWKPHPGNPVVVDARGSRMAGNIFASASGESMIRPAQDCEKEYGRSISLRRIDELSESTYRETPIETVDPEKKLRAVCTHTINRTSKYIVRDIKTRKFRLW